MPGKEKQRAVHVGNMYITCGEEGTGGTWPFCASAYRCSPLLVEAKRSGVAYRPLASSKAVPDRNATQSDDSSLQEKSKKVLEYLQKFTYLKR